MLHTHTPPIEVHARGTEPARAPLPAGCSTNGSSLCRNTGLILPHGFHKSTCQLCTASNNARAKRASYKHAWPFADLKCIPCHVFFYKMKLQPQKAVRSKINNCTAYSSLASGSEACRVSRKAVFLAGIGAGAALRKLLVQVAQANHASVPNTCAAAIMRSERQLAVKQRTSARRQRRGAPRGTDGQDCVRSVCSAALPLPPLTRH